MATSYGYTQPRYGGYVNSPGLNPTAAKRYTSGVASALAGGSPLTGGGGSTQAPISNPIKPVAPVRPGNLPSLPPGYGPAAVNPNRVPINTAPTATPGAYDINTDPVLQQIQALTGMGDEQANAAALKQRQQLLLGYGDQGLASAVLGANDPTVQAAAQNPASIIAQLATQHGRNLSQLEDALNKANLFYGGYRVNQLGQDTQDYQTQLANQAGQVQGALDTITGNLTSALGQNQAQRAQAAQDAADRAAQAALQQGYGDQISSLQDALAQALAGGGAAGGTDYVSSTQPGTIYADQSGQPVSIQPSGAIAPAYVGPSGQFVSPETYAGAGAVPQPITPDMVSPPVQPTELSPNLATIAAALYPSAGGQTGGNTPITSTITPPAELSTYSIPQSGVSYTAPDQSLAAALAAPPPPAPVDPYAGMYFNPYTGQWQPTPVIPPGQNFLA